MTDQKPTLDYAKPNKQPLPSLLTRCLDIVQWGIAIGIVVYFIAWVANLPHK
jgi:hypothetical protein